MNIREHLKFLYPLKFGSIYYSNYLRVAAELRLGHKPMKPPVPKVRKADSIDKILFVAKGRDDRFDDSFKSFDYNYLYEPACELADASFFDFKDIYERHGKKEMNQRLIEEIRREDPDLIFFCIIGDHIEPSIVQGLSEYSRAITYNWFSDDHWMFEYHGRYWAHKFNFCSTTDKRYFEKYQRLGYSNIIMTQWAANPNLHRKLNLKKDIDVSFAGLNYIGRKEIMKYLEDKGIHVECFGHGWENGRISWEEMIRVFNRSRINLNFTTTNYGPVKQIKARNFDVPGSGGFLLTEYAPALEEYYEPGKEVAVFRDREELVEMIDYYLLHDKEREAIADAGYKRTMKEHTYTQRLEDVFGSILEGAQKD